MATGGTGAYTWSVTDGALPEGLTLSSAGAISGTPTTLGSFAFTVRVMDAAAATHSSALSIVIARIEELSGSGISGEAGSTRYFAVAVPTGAARLTVSMSGGTGDNEETCTFTPPAAGSW